MSFGSDRGTRDGFCDPLGALLAALGPVRDLDPVADPALKDDLLRFARHRSREDAMFATWVLAAVRAGIGVEDGYVDTIGWLAWKTGTARAEQIISTAAVLTCPAFHAAPVAGSNSHSSASRTTRRRSDREMPVFHDSQPIVSTYPSSTPTW